jgi:hypothetical protein
VATLRCSAPGGLAEILVSTPMTSDEPARIPKNLPTVARGSGGPSGEPAANSTVASDPPTARTRPSGPGGELPGFVSRNDSVANPVSRRADPTPRKTRLGRPRRSNPCASLSLVNPVRRTLRTSSDINDLVSTSLKSAARMRVQCAARTERLPREHGRAAIRFRRECDLASSHRFVTMQVRPKGMESPETAVRLMTPAASSSERERIVRLHKTAAFLAAPAFADIVDASMPDAGLSSRVVMSRSGLQSANRPFSTLPQQSRS